MGRMFSRAFPLGNLMWVGIDAVGLFLAILFGYMLLYPGGANALWSSIPGALAIVVAMVLLTGSMGLYQDDVKRRFWPAVLRASIAFAVVLPGLHWVFFRLPDGSVCAPCLTGTIAFAFAAKLVMFLFSGASPLRQRRVMILGVGADAAAVNDMLERSKNPSLSVVGFYAPFENQTIDGAVPANKVISATKSIGEVTGRHNVSEIVIAMRERRGGSLPLNELLNC